VVSGLQVYFDKSLGANLLYRFERPQYAEIRKRYITGRTVKVGEEKDMSSVYGAEHLLRMIGEFLSLSFYPTLAHLSQ
jgi:mortality factor 4-like protein 1